MRSFEQTANLRLVKQIIQSKIERNEPDEILNEYIQPCGTYGCVLGEYVIARNSEYKGDDLTLHHFCLTLDTTEEFGVPLLLENVLFGPRLCGSLDERLEWVEHLIMEDV